MKFYFTLPLLFLALFHAAQASADLQTNITTWFVTNVSFNPYLGHENEGCWPNGTITFSSNQSGSLFTASEWTGPACEDYDLTGGESFYIGNDSQYGHIDSNGSVQFNYNQINPSTILLNLWYGCNSDGYCDTTADVILSAENPSPCLFYFDSYYVNLCPISSSLTARYIFVNNFSIFGNNVINCEGTQNIWGTLIDAEGCHDIATQAPSIVLWHYSSPLDSPNNVWFQITFPVLQSPNSSRSFQLFADLNCDYDGTNYQVYSSMSTNLTSNLTIIHSSIYSPYVCAQPTGCSSLVVGSDSYNLCPFQQSNLTFFNISDQVLGQLSFNLGNTPLTPNCPGNSVNKVFATYNTPDDCFILAPNPLTFYPNAQGLVIRVNSFNLVSQVYNVTGNIVIQLECNPSQLSVAEFNPYMNISAGGPSLSLTLQGSSPYACPQNSTETLNA